jgi:hypothetical protein
VAIAVLIAAIPVATTRIAAHHSRVPHLPAGAARDIVVEADLEGRLRLFPLDGRHSVERIYTIRGKTVFGLGPAVLLGNNVIAWIGGDVVVRVAEDPLKGKVSRLGFGIRLVAGPRPGQLWIVSIRQSGRAQLIARLACVSGTGVYCGELSPPVVIPGGQTPVGQVSGGLILLSPSGARPGIVWDPFSGVVKFHFPAAFRHVIDSHLNLVAWLSGPGDCAVGYSRCVVHLTDIAAGVDRVLSPPAGYGSYLPGGAFSPDGHYLALFAANLADPQAARPVIVTLDQPSPDLQLPDLVIPLGDGIAAAAWDPSGKNVFVSGAFGSVFLCQATNPACVDVHVPVSSQLAVTAPGAKPPR